MTAQLLPIHAGTGPTIALQRPVILIGRHPECDVRIDSPEVSRRHCCLAIANDRLMIRDLGSRNGVRVNGQKVDEVQLRPGDEIAIAQFLYRLDATPSPVAPRASKPTGRPAPTPPPMIESEGDFIPLDD